MSEQFDEQGNGFETDDVEAHRIPDHVGRDLDVEGHLGQIEVDDDVVGKQGLRVQPPRDADNQGNQF